MSIVKIVRLAQHTLVHKNIAPISVKCYCSCTSARRTSETNPTNHDRDQFGLFYTIPDDDKNKLFSFGGLPKPFKKNVNTFAETSLMIREPAIEVINYLKNTDFKKPAIRYVLYGRKGCGKSLSLLHILHYAHVNNFYLIHVPWVWDWFRNNRTDVSNSELQPGLIDLPVLSAAWLKHFQSQNSNLLAEDDIKLSKDYVWNQRETTPAGSSISDLIIHGINRIKYAGGCVDAVIKELKLAASQSKCKVLVALDGINCLFGTESNYKTEDKVKVTPKMVTLTHTFLDATKQDWTNGAVVVTVDQRAGREHELASHLPLYLLQRSGFEHLDPFVGINVKEFSDLELHSMLDYYEDRQWIQRKGPDYRGELSFLSNKNPFQLMALCNSL